MTAQRPPLVINCRPLTDNYDLINPPNLSGTHMRTGGAVAQVAYGEASHIPAGLTGANAKNAAVWTDEKIANFSAFCASQAKKVMHTWNFNDTPENQVALTHRLIDAGCDITDIIIGNETYLGKFLTDMPNKAGLGAVRKYTVQEINERTIAFAQAIRNNFPGIRVLVPGAILTGRNIDFYRNRFNNEMKGLFAVRPELFDGWDVHVYKGKDGATSEEESSTYPLSSLDHFPGPIIFGETGHKQVTDTPEGIVLYKSFNMEGLQYARQRNDGSAWGVHVLFNQHTTAAHYSLYDTNGITFLGLLHNQLLGADAVEPPSAPPIEPIEPPVEEPEPQPEPPTGDEPILVDLKLQYSSVVVWTQRLIFSDGSELLRQRSGRKDETNPLKISEVKGKPKSFFV